MTEAIRDLWAADTVHQPPLSTEELHRRSARLDARVRRRDRIEYVAGGFVILVFAAIAVLVPLWPLRLAFAAVMIGTAMVMRNLARRSPPPSPAALGRDSLGYYRARLTQQSAALHSVWRWYLGPLIPGMLMIYATIGWLSAERIGWLTALAHIAPQLAVPVGAFLFIGWLNARTARALDREIAALDAVKTSEHPDREETLK